MHMCVEQLAKEQLVPFGMAVFDFQGVVFGCRLETYGPILGVKIEWLKSLSDENKKNPVLCRDILIERINAAIHNFKTIVQCAPDVFKGISYWEEDLFQTINHITQYSKDWFHELKTKDEHDFYRIPINPSTNPFKIIISSADQIIVKTKLILLQTQRKTVYLGIQFYPEIKSVVCIKPVRTLQNYQFNWNREIEFANKLILAEEKNGKLRGILTPLMIYQEEKIDEVDDSEEEKVRISTMLIYEKMHDLLNFINYSIMPLKEILTVISDISSGLYTLHSEFKLAHHDFKPDNALVSNNGRGFVIDYDCHAPIEKSLKGYDLGGTLGYVPPESMLHMINNDFRPVHNTESWDPWTLGMVIYMLLIKEAPAFYNSQKACNYPQFIFDLRKFHASPFPIETPLAGVIKHLLMEDPAMRLKIVDAYPIINALCS